MPPKTRPPKPRPVGRPQELPDGTRVRAFRVTNSEWDALKTFLKQLRRKK